MERAGRVRVGVILRQRTVRHNADGAHRLRRAYTLEMRVSAYESENGVCRLRRILAALALAASLTVPIASQRDDAAVDVRTVPVPLNTQDPTQARIGAFTYAGGLEIRGVSTDRLHGLSDLAVLPDGRLIAVSDEGNLFEARIVLDARGRLSSLSDARLERLIDLDGKPLQGKKQSDAEGLAVLPNGDRLISFERNHRIWRYPAAGGRPVAVGAPTEAFPANEGIESVAAYSFAGAGAFLAGSEGGKVWLCNMADGCRITMVGSMVPSAYGLTAMAAYGNDGALVLLARAYDAKRGPRAIVRLLGRRAIEMPRVIAELMITAPLTRDNFEGIAVVPQARGALRLYLVSDDNFSRTQHTYLLAFDWTSS